MKTIRVLINLKKRKNFQQSQIISFCAVHNQDSELLLFEYLYISFLLQNVL